MKPSIVKFASEKLSKEFNSLDNSDPIKKQLVKAIRDLSENAYCGIQIPKRLIPETYIKRYNINNLWKYNISSSWRLIYSLTSEDEIELICAILEWFNHKEYERRFNY
jgi:Txe/YoeB family toxin of Txe-Axe toxin-antitoxin module